MEGGAGPAGRPGRARVAHGSFTIGDGADPGENAGNSLSEAGFERELLVLEQSIKRLSAECDAFLYGSASKPPVEGRRHVEEMLRRLNASDSMSAAERYRFSTLQGRFFALVERWERLLAGEGVRPPPGPLRPLPGGLGGGSGGPSDPQRGPGYLRTRGAGRRPGRSGSGPLRAVRRRQEGPRRRRERLPPGGLSGGSRARAAEGSGEVRLGRRRIRGRRKRGPRAPDRQEETRDRMKRWIAIGTLSGSGSGAGHLRLHSGPGLVGEVGSRPFLQKVPHPGQRARRRDRGDGEEARGVSQRREPPQRFRKPARSPPLSRAGRGAVRAGRQARSRRTSSRCTTSACCARPKAK